MDQDDALRAAELELARWNASLQPNRLADPGATTHDPEDEFVVTRVEEHSRAWVVHFATRRYLATQDWRDIVVGACPLVVDRITGELHSYGSVEHARFAAWLDTPPDE